MADGGWDFEPIHGVLIACAVLLGMNAFMRYMHVLRKSRGSRSRASATLDIAAPITRKMKACHLLPQYP